MADDAEDTDRSPDSDASDGDDVDAGSAGDDAVDAADGGPTDADSDASGGDSADETAGASAPDSDADPAPDSDADPDSASDGDDSPSDSGPDSEPESAVDPPTDTPDIHPRAEEIAAAADPDSGDAEESDAVDEDEQADDTAAESESDGTDDDAEGPSAADDGSEAPTVADVAAEAAAEDADTDPDADVDTDAGDDTDSDADTDADAGDNTDSDADIDTDAGDNTDSDADTDADSDTESAFDSDTESEIGPSSAEIVAGTDGGAAVSAGETGAADPAPAVDEGFEPEGPESDREMPLADHIEEMVRRLAVVLIIGGVVTLLLYPGADLVNSAFGVDLVSSTQVIDFLWNKHIPGAPEMVDRRPRVYGPLELVLTELKVAALGGLVVGLPAFVYETYLFMRPGLYPKERRYYLAAVPTSVILAFVGISFAHFVVLPAIFAYFTSYTTGTALVAFGLKETFNLILILMGYNAIIFQIPLFVMLAIMMNLVTRTWMEERRLLFWGTFLGLAFLVSPDPTGMAPIIIALTMIGLFEGTLLALRWTKRGN